MRQEAVTWREVEKLIDYLIPQFKTEFDAMVMITRGGIVPGGLLAEALNIKTLLTASVDFPAEMEYEQQRKKSHFMAWPKFVQFPDDELLYKHKILIVDDVWGSGRTITAVKNRITSANSEPFTCVLHFNPYRSLFGKAEPDYYAAITDAYIVYPWEINRGRDRVLLNDFN
jgi:hypoxanthine phosphoribosyltransferase